MERLTRKQYTRSRSRSPQESNRERASHRERSSSPTRHHRTHHHRREREERHHHSRKRKRSPPEPAILPFKAAKLARDDLLWRKALFGSYLDIQKQLIIEELSEDEVMGRWKSFRNKWNRGQLAEGWYDPETSRKVNAAAEAEKEYATKYRKATPPRTPPSAESSVDKGEDDEDEESYGPALPENEKQLLVNNSAVGASAPNFSDLVYRDELVASEAADQRAWLRQDRKIDRRLQKDRFEELAPRAEPGTKERQMEKKRDAALANKAYRDAASGGVEEVGDGELMGEGGIEEVKRKQEQYQRKKNEREIRKEEILRARAAEREERMAEHRKKEDETMTMLKALAKERFG